MTQPETSIVFAGVDGRADAHLPAWFAEKTGERAPWSFADAVRALPRATAAPIAYQNPYSGAWMETDRFTALVDPERLAEQASMAGDADSDAGVVDGVDPLFHVPTDSYAIINPTDVYAPLEDVLRRETLDGRPLGDVVFGEIRQYRGGGEVHMDIMFDGLAVDLPDRGPITVGVSSGYDYFGGHAVYVEGFAQDTYCANSMRRLTDRMTVKHVGDVESFTDWWEHILGRLDVVANDLYAFIVDAQDITLDLTDVPFDLVEFYSLLGFPEYLAKRAAGDARAEAADPLNIDLWTLHSGATYALTHFYSGKEGASLDGYVRVANDLLFNPEATLDLLRDEYKRRAQAEAKDGQTGLESQVALAQLERVTQSVQAKADQFERREAVLRDRFEPVEG